MSEIHVMPTNDIKEHEESILCWCKPRRDWLESNMVVHNVFSDKYGVEERDVE